MNFYYDKQVRRFLTQIISIFSHFEVEYGKDDDNNVIYRRVPVKYATTDRMVASILRNNSENILIAAPQMAVYITSLEYDRERIQNPTHVEKLHIRQARKNRDTGEPGLAQGNAFTLERLMPVPYKLSFNVDIWTTSTDQKLQLLEQILVLFNPDFEIQNTDNYLDWGSLSYIHIDSVSYSSRTIPAGNDDAVDIATLSFHCPIWINPPSKLKKLGVIETIITSIYDADGNLSEGVIDGLTRLGERIYTTPMGYNLLILNGQATLYPAGGPLLEGNDISELPEAGTDPIAWAPYVNQFGQIKNGITQLRLRKDNPDTISEIVGTVSYHPTDPTVLLFNVDQDTIPENTLRPVNAIIDPMRSGPGIKGLPAASIGQRYLLLNPINSGKGDNTNYDGADAWKSIVGEDLFAEKYDIIEYDGSRWIVSWDASDIASKKIEFVSNLNTSIQYKWNGEDWVKSWEGDYPQGQFSLVF